MARLRPVQVENTVVTSQPSDAVSVTNDLPRPIAQATSNQSSIYNQTSGHHDVTVSLSANAAVALAHEMNMDMAQLAPALPFIDFRLGRLARMAREAEQLVCPGERPLWFTVIRDGRWRVDLLMTSFPTPLDLLSRVS